MSKSKSVYKTDLPSFFRKSSFDIKSMQGLNPQIFTIQAQSFINQNFFHNNAELMHEKSNNFISNLRKLNQKKLKSERTTSDMKKINNKSASSFAGSSTLEGGWTRKLNLRLNTSAQNRDPIKVNNKSRKIIPIDLKQIENVFENLMNISISGTHTNKELDEVFVGLYDKTPNNDNNNNSNMSGILQILKNFLEKSLGIVSSNANEIKDLKETLKEFNRMKEEEMRKHLSEISELKKSLETQTTQLQMLQAKEKQLIQFLLAIKARGVIDLESIFNEEFNMAKPSEPKKKNSISLEKTTKSKTILPGSSFFELSQEADISIINDSEESSFNYLGKSENSGVLTPMPVPKVYLNQGNKKNKGLPDNLKLNLKYK